jgi:hypothetical protein
MKKVKEARVLTWNIEDMYSTVLVLSAYCLKFYIYENNFKFSVHLLNSTNPNQSRLYSKKRHYLVEEWGIDFDWQKIDFGNKIVQFTAIFLGFNNHRELLWAGVGTWEIFGVQPQGCESLMNKVRNKRVLT